MWSKTGQRNIRHRELGAHALLFVGEGKMEGNQTQTSVFLGQADYVSHSGERPLAITWRLRIPMPAGLLQQATSAVA